MTIEPTSPFPSRFKAWLDERFPFANAPAYFLFYLAAAVIVDVESDQEVSLGWNDLMSCIVLVSFFLLLRIFDEHKDYEEDLVNHPDRVLQKGLITLKHLKVAGVISVILTFTWSVHQGGGMSGTLYAWAIMTGWSFLMAVEFFCGTWLGKRLTLYALSHMAIMPMIAWWCMSLSVTEPPVTENTILISCLFFFSGLVFEINRKTRGPEEERDGVDGYSKIFGTKGSALIVILLILVVAGLIVRLLMNVQGGFDWLSLAPMGIATLLAIAIVFRFILNPSAKGRKANEGVLGLLALFAFGSVIVVTSLTHGVVWLF